MSSISTPIGLRPVVTIQDLKTIVERLEANQHVTEEDTVEADTEIKHLEPANDNGTKAKIPAEPSPTPAVTNKAPSNINQPKVDPVASFYPALLSDAKPGTSKLCICS